MFNQKYEQSRLLNYSAICNSLDSHVSFFKLTPWPVIS